MFLTPTHIAVGPLTHGTVSLVASAIVEIYRQVARFDMLQVSVLCEDADMLDQVVSGRGAPRGSEFDAVRSTLTELRALGIPIGSSVETLVPDPKGFANAFLAEPNSTRAPISWFVDMAPAATPLTTIDLGARRAQYAPHVVSGRIKKIVYLRPAELTAPDAKMLDHEVLVRYGLLAEDLPYLPAADDVLSCPVQAATSALFTTGARSRRSSMSPVRFGMDDADLGRPGAVPLSRSATWSSTTSAATASLLRDDQGRMQVPHPVVYPLPLGSLMYLLVNIVASKFIYESTYFVTGAALHLPGVSPDPLCADELPPVPALPIARPGTAANARSLTPPPSPPFSPPVTMSERTLSSTSDDDCDGCNEHHHHHHIPAIEVEDDDSHGERLATVLAQWPPVDARQAAEVASHLDLLHAHAHAAPDVQLAALTTASGRSLAGIAVAYQRGHFSRASSDYVRALSETPPVLHVVKTPGWIDDDENDDDEEDARGRGGYREMHLHVEGGKKVKQNGEKEDQDEWDELVYGPLADVDQYPLAGGKYTVAVRAVPRVLETLGY
ncbi:hypothetical protein GGF32_004143 [Allomyces javanicus]|nr:hypothetical protein GGF32_004143 [Allomyces javanicus]